MTTYETACRVVDEAGQAGGIEEVRRIADRGWPGDVGGQAASPELLTAIQERARTSVADVDAEMTYTIETHRDGQWTSDGLGDSTGYESREAAERAIESLVEMGGEWASHQYRVVEDVGARYEVVITARTGESLVSDGRADECCYVREEVQS